MGEDQKKLCRRTRKLFADYDHNCIKICENELGQLAEEERISEILTFGQEIQLNNDSTKTPDKQFPLLLNRYSDEAETPTLCHCYDPAKKAIQISRL